MLLLIICLTIPAATAQYGEGGGEDIHVPWKTRPVLGGVKTVFLLVQFEDVRFGSSLQDIQYFVESADSWFRTSSYGKMYIDYVIIDYVIQLPSPISSYGNPEAGTQRGDSEEGLKRYWDDVIDMVDRQTDIDLADFKDVVVIHAGGDEAVSGDPYDIWSHCLAYGPISDELGENGLWVMGRNGNIQNLWGMSTFSEDEDIGVFLHEYSHSLGVPDLYIYGSDGYSQGTGVSFWSLMDSGPFLKPPSDIDAWDKYLLGWVDPVMVNSPTGEYTLHTLDSSQDSKALIVGYTGTYDKYYFIQARRRMGTDAGLPADGVLVFMIDPTREQSVSGSELALMEDANPGTVEESGQFYLDESAMHYELLDAPYNKGDETYRFSMGSISAQFVLKNNFFWDKDNKIAFLVEPTDDTSFRIRFGSSPEELGVEVPQEEGGGTQPSGCIIATAAYGGSDAPPIKYMRYVRDNLIGASVTGRRLVDGWNSFYYSWSPTVAALAAKSNSFKLTLRVLLFPLIGITRVAAYAFGVMSPVNVELASLFGFFIAATLSISLYIVTPLAIVFLSSRRFVKRTFHRLRLR
jgi:M6 family metalloprotease-like protein